MVARPICSATMITVDSATRDVEMRGIAVMEFVIATMDLPIVIIPSQMDVKPVY